MPRLNLPKLSMPQLRFRRPGTPATGSVPAESPGAGSAAGALPLADEVRRRRLLIAACGGAALAVLLLGYVLLGRSPSAPAVSADQASVPSSAATASPSPSATASDLPSSAVDAAVARDPFQILYPDQTGGSGSGTGSGTGAGAGSGTDTGTYTGSGKGTYNTGSGTTSSGTTGSGTNQNGTSTPPSTPPTRPSTPSTRPSTPSTSPSTPPTSPPPTDPTRHNSVALIGSPRLAGSTYQATFQVDGSTVYTATTGGTFAGSLKVLSVHSDINGVLYATVQYRTATPFDIAAGQTELLSG